MRLFCLLLLFVSATAYSQTEEERVKATITRLFDGIRGADSVKLRSAFAPQAILQTIIKDKEGKVKIQTEEVNKFIAAVTKPHAEVYDERIQFETVKIDADLAVAWTPYKFYLGEKFSHCGVNSFQLVRLEGEWKIQYLIDTRRRQPCE